MEYSHRYRLGTRATTLLSGSSFRAAFYLCFCCAVPVPFKLYPPLDVPPFVPLLSLYESTSRDPLRALCGNTIPISRRFTEFFSVIEAGKGEFLHAGKALQSEITIAWNA